MHRKVSLAVAVALLGLLAGADAGPFRNHPSSINSDHGSSSSSSSFFSFSGGSSPSSSHESSRSSSREYRKVRTTAYTHTEDDHREYRRNNALGTRLQCSRRYTSAAADWSRYPVGTVFRIKGSRTEYVIDDYGSALVGTGTIDIYHRNKRGMDKWGVRHVEIEILKWGSFSKSREILQARLKYDHCRQMYVALVGRSAWEAIASRIPT